MEWPKQSPDLNPIKNLWHKLKTKVKNWKTRNLEKYCIEEWSKISVDVCKNVVDKYPRRIQTVIKNKGHAIDYL